MNKPNRDLAERARSIFPGGALGSFALPAGQEFVVTRAEGPRLYDETDRPYLDCLLGSGPMILGHAHPAVVAAVREQVERGSTFYTMNDVAIRLAEKIVEATGFAEMLKFCSSGSEATFYALRLARGATGRNKILKFEGAYHGHHDYAMLSTTPSGAEPLERALPDTAGIPDLVRQEVLIAPYNDLETTVALLEREADDVAAVIVEPGCRLIDPEPGFLEGLRAVTERLGILLVFDEVVTGFRIAYGGARAFYGVTPDLVCYGKIIGGGYPLAAVAGRRAVMELSNPRERPTNYVYMSGTLNGNPVAATAGLATLAELEKPESYARLNAVGETLRAGLREIASRHGLPAQVLGVGPMANIYFTETPIHDYRSSLAEDKPLKEALRRELLRRRVLANLAAKLYLSTVHSDADMAQVLETFDTALSAIGR